MSTQIAQPMRFSIDLDDGLVMQPQRTVLAWGNKNANRIIVRLTKGGQKFELSDVAVIGKFVRPRDGGEITLDGTIENGEAVITLSEHCYQTEGRYSAEVILTAGDVKRTVLTISGNVQKTSTGVIVDVAGVIPSVDDIVAQYGEMQRIAQETKEKGNEAEKAAGRADDAAADAITAAGIADTATGAANTAAGVAIAAADRANAAADAVDNALIDGPVISVNGQNGVVVLDAAAVGALAAEGTAQNAAALGGKAATLYAMKNEIPAAYVLPTASDETLGGVKIGEGLEIDAESGVINTRIKSVATDFTETEPGKVADATLATMLNEKIDNLVKIGEITVTPNSSGQAASGIMSADEILLMACVPGKTILVFFRIAATGEYYLHFKSASSLTAPEAIAYNVKYFYIDNASGKGIIEEEAEPTATEEETETDV